MKYLLLFVLLPLLGFSQSAPMTQEEAKEYFKNNKTEILGICEKQPLYEVLKGHRERELIESNGKLMQITRIHPDAQFCVGYIFMDAKKLSEEEIKEKREQIFKKHQSGIAFKDLIKEYNTDGNPSADFYSFSERGIVPQFTEAVKSHKTGEVFTIDVPDRGWYYVAIRNEDNKLPVYSVKVAALPKR
ncbi:hypothetical protein GR160_09235 [Flavobacterium sp. Sd200]|uniref:peptidylprolyl isomerase n=1 Tax=Flavobacterium sp. Sd200 TaxID=2692211 RepID=UPI00136B7AB0|nr:peptidylprolyl isomerase [Flavobacterium sp. Sd200]MXN91411.1 hypothetical protein [Flavobacterium sp. Sd200]